MKKILILAYFSFNVIILSQTGWNVAANLWPNYNCLFFVNSQTGWVASNLGHIAKSTDGGFNWTIISPGGGPMSANGILFSDVNNGMVAAGPYFYQVQPIWYTSNGGNYWEPFSFPTHQGANFRSVTFYNGSYWFCGTFSDGYPTLVMKSCIVKLNPITEYIFNHNRILNKIKAGLNDTWAVGDSGLVYRSLTQCTGIPYNPNLTGVTSPANNICYVVGEQYVYKSINNGSNWNRIQPFIPNWTYKDIYFANQDTGWILCNLPGDSAGAIIRTNNGGLNWHTQYTGLIGNEIYFVNSQTGFILCNDYILKTVTGGEPTVAPPSPILFSPSNNSTNRPITDTLKWYKATGATTYRLQLSIDSVFSTLLINDSTITDSLHNVNLSPLTSYYWRVNAKNTYGTSAYSSVWKFTTVSAVPSPPVLVSPPNNLATVTTTPMLDWGDVSSASGYRVQVARDTSFNNIKYDTNGLVQSQITVPPGKLFNDSVYYWRVRAYNAYGNGSWSSVWNFTPIVQIWFQMISGVNAVIYDIHFPNAYTGIATSFGPSYILRSTNSGLTWTNTSYNINGIYLYNVKFINDDTGWIIGNNPNSPYTNVILKSTNAGLNWSSQYQGSGRLRGISFINDNTGWIGGDNLYKTTNGGTNWTVTNPTGYIPSYSLHFINDMTGWMGSLLSTTISVQKTTNGGISWFSQLSGGNCRDLQFLDALTGYAATEGGVKKTINGGQNWTTVLSAPWALSVSFLNAMTGWAVPLISSNTENFRTTNGGVTWTDQGFVFPSLIEGLNVQSYNLGFAVCSNGTIYRTTTGGVWVSHEQVNRIIPDKMNLYQNYPNPFNPITTIKFDIDKKTYVQIIVYDVLGRELVKLVDEEINTGTYQTVWNADNYPSGVYIYKIIADRISQSKKMILLK